MKLGTKIAILLGALEVVVLAVLGVLDLARDEAFFFSDTKRDQAIVAGVLEAAIEHRGSEERPEGEGTEAFLASALEGDPSMRATWGWLDPKPPPSLPSGARAQWAKVLAGERITFRVRGATPEQWTIVSGQTKSGRRFYVALKESLADERAHVRATELRTALTIGLLAAIGSIVIVLVGSRLISRPAKKLVEHARAVAAGDFGRRLDVRQRDEIGDLAREMNSMSEALSSARERVETETRKRLTAVEQLRHADRLTTVGKLASGLAHELGTPLNVALGYARIIQKRHRDDAETRGAAETIAGQVEKMTRLVRQLLDFARRKEIKKGDVDLGALGTKVASILAPTAKKKGLAIEARVASRAVVPADATMIEQVVTNLVFNAIQASDEGAAPIEVDVSVVEGAPAQGGEEGVLQGDAPLACDTFARIAVTDHGGGIAKGDLQRIFEPFFTTKPVGEGTGLGLSVSLGIVQDHHGLVRVKSEPGRGTTFEVYLPTVDLDAPISLPGPIGAPPRSAAVTVQS